MEMKEVVLIMLTIFATLLTKWLWDRFFSKESRVTKETCDNHRKNFEMSMKRLEYNVEGRLIEGEKTFKKIGSCLTASCLIMLQLCEKAQIDCSDIKQKMIDAGMNL